MFAGLPELGISNGEDLKETLTNCTEPLKAIDQFQVHSNPCCAWTVLSCAPERVRNKIQVHCVPSATCFGLRCFNEWQNQSVNAIHNTLFVRRAHVYPKSVEILWYFHGMNAAFISSQAGCSNLEPTGCCCMRELQCIDTAVSCKRADEEREPTCKRSGYDSFCSQILMHMWTPECQWYTHTYFWCLIKH